MNLTIDKIDSEEARFTLDNCNVNIANSLRRIMIAEIPCYAIHNVDIICNTSNIDDEILVHRLGLIPIISDKEEEIAIGNIKLDIDCNKHLQMVTTDDIVSDIELEKNILIAKLSKGQKLKIECSIKKGLGREHAKYVVSIVGFEKLDENRYGFTVEPIGQMAPYEIITTALSILKNKLKNLENNLKN